MDDVDHAADNSEQAGPPERIDLARVVLAQARRNARLSAYRKPTFAARRRGGQPMPSPVTLSRVFTEMFPASGMTGDLFAAWGTLAGPDLSRHLVPVAFDASSGTMTLRADSQAWATQARLLADILASRLTAESRTMVNTIAVVVKSFAPADPRSPAATPGLPLAPTRVRTPAPVDGSVRAAAERLARTAPREQPADFAEALTPHARRPFSHHTALLARARVRAAAARPRP